MKEKRQPQLDTVKKKGIMHEVLRKRNTGKK